MSAEKITSATKCLDIIRQKNRPTVNDYIPAVFHDFVELHGDRNFGDDDAILGGIATFEVSPGKFVPLTVIAQVKGRNFEENKRANFAMPHPEGYRKALRLAKQAEKFGRAVVCLIDTPGAYPGLDAEERGQGEAIARDILEFMQLKTPVVSIVLGEGGSGGALALAVCDELAMLSNAIYSVISPQGFASILWKDPTREKEAAEIMKITAPDLLDFEVCDKIIEEPDGGAHLSLRFVADNIAAYLSDVLPRLSALSTDVLLKNRYQKFRKIGFFNEESTV